ncbi:hypothetical protein MHYP_G00282070 [Metynnis hypsauchen]
MERIELEKWVSKGKEIKHPGRMMEKISFPTALLMKIKEICTTKHTKRHRVQDICWPEGLHPEEKQISVMLHQGLRLFQLHKDLQECKTGEDRVQFLENLILTKSPGTSYP